MLLSYVSIYGSCVSQTLFWSTPPSHICVEATCPCIHCVATACTYASQALFLVNASKSHSSLGNHLSLCAHPMLLHPWDASHPSSLPIVTCFSKGHYHPLLMSQAHASLCCCYGTMPRSFLLLVQQRVMTFAYDSSSMHEALGPHVSHPTSCFELASLLLHLHAASKQ